MKLIGTCEGLEAMYPESISLKHLNSTGSRHRRDLGRDSMDTSKHQGKENKDNGQTSWISVIPVVVCYGLT